jgi:spermidine synthase
LQKLNLDSNELTALPPAIGQLIHLQWFDLSWNELAELPSAIGQMSNLERLVLDTNKLTELPPAIGQLTHLQSLTFGRNQLTALPSAIGQLIHLKSLYLNVNQLTALPPEIGQMSNLQELDLSCNQITVLLPEISQLIHLKSLCLFDNQLTVLPPAIGQLLNLKTLGLDNNQLTVLPPEISQLSNLQRLYLKNNQLTVLPPEISQLSNLQELNLSHNQLSALPPKIGQLYLQKLDLDNNQLTVLPPAIGQLLNLEKLSLDNNQLELLPESINQLIHLKQLNLKNNKLIRLPSSLQILFEKGKLECKDNPMCALPKENWFTEWAEETLYPFWQQRLNIDQKIILEKTAQQNLLIFENSYFGRVLVLDGVVQTTEADGFVCQEMLAHVPLLAHENPKHVLIIGGGDGGMLREVLRHTTIEKVTLIEIDGSVVERSKKYLPSLSNGAFEDPRLELLIEDGVVYVEKTNQKYDAVICDSTSPIGPAAVLFTEKFYGQCKRVLNEKGIFVNQNGVPFLQKDEFLCTLKNRSKHFKDVGFYVAPVPTSVGGFMAFGWASDYEEYRRVSEETLRQRLTRISGSMKYYNPGIHKAAFCLPQFMVDWTNSLDL